MKQKKIPDITSVVENDLCIACGACIHICPKNNIIPVFNSYRGAEEVAIQNTDVCSMCPAPCDDVCPSIEVNLLKLVILNNQAKEEELSRQGNIKEMYTAFAPDFVKNGISSSGGVIRLLIQDALNSNIPVLCLSKLENKYGPSIIYNEKDIEKIPGSIYHSISFTDSIALLNKAKKKIRVIGLPCHMEGLMKYAQYNPLILEKIELIVGIICGWMYTHHSIKAFMKYKNIEGDFTDAGYRGEDRVGKLKIKTNNGTLHMFNRRIFETLKDKIDFQASFATPMNRLRCRLCENHLNVIADVVVGDAWLSRNPHQKLSVVATRTLKGSTVINNLISSERLQVKNGEKNDLIESQSANLVFATDAKSFSRYLQSKGIAVPKFIYGDKNKNGSKKFLKYWYEMIMRELIRKNKYITYRWLYFLKNGHKIILSFLLVKYSKIINKE